MQGLTRHGGDVELGPRVPLDLTLPSHGRNIDVKFVRPVDTTRSGLVRVGWRAHVCEIGWITSNGLIGALLVVEWRVGGRS
jgi:hypothetical protein